MRNTLPAKFAHCLREGLGLAIFAFGAALLII